MFDGETDLVCRYHEDYPDGKIFTRKDFEGVPREGWVDSPGKLLEEPDSLTTGTSEVNAIAEKLLKGEGLNFSSFIRAHGKDPKNQKVKKDLKGEYNELLEYYQDKYEGKIYKQGHDWFLKDK
jgi:hypothetical protein